MFEKILEILKENSHHIQIIEINQDEQYIRFYVISDAPSPNPDCMIYIKDNIIYEGVDYVIEEDGSINIDDMINFNSFDEWKEDFIEEVFDEDDEADEVYFSEDNPEVVFVEVKDGKIIKAYCGNRSIEEIYVFNADSSDLRVKKNLKKVKSDIPSILIVEE